MKNFILLFLLLIVSNSLSAQNLKPESLSISYFGENFIHPGMNISADYILHQWNQIKTRKGVSETTLKNWELRPGFGFWNEKNTKTSVFVLIEFNYSRTCVRGNTLKAGIGSGYLHSKINIDYEDFTKENSLISSLFLYYGKDFSMKKQIPIELFAKPEYFFNFNNIPLNSNYFTFQFGLNYKLKFSNF